MGFLIGGVEAIEVDGKVMQTAGLVQLMASTAASANDHATFRKSDDTGTTGYSPAAGKQFRVLAISFQNNSAAGQSANPIFMQSDNDVGQESGTALTNQLYPGGMGAGQARSADGDSARASLPMNFVVATGKYFSVISQSSGATTFRAWGREEAV